MLCCQKESAMIDSFVRFYRPMEVLIFLLIAIISGLWAYSRFGKKLTVSFWPLVVLNTVFLVFLGIFMGASHVESGHLHLGWLVSQGLTPYKDFFEHHSPFLSVLIAPFVSWLKSSGVMFDILRIVSGFMFAINILLGWQIARQAWKEKAELSIYLLVLSSVASTAQYLLLRPDIFMIFFLLAVVRLSFEISGKRVLPSFFAGIAFSLAASFVPKQYLLVFLPVIAVFLGEKKKRPLKLVLYFLGLAIGCLPLLSYLVSHGILKDYLFWMFGFNSQIVVFKVMFPLEVLALGGWGAYSIFSRFGKLWASSTLLFIAFCLSTASSLTTTTDVSGEYYLGFWFFICAIIGCGCPLLGVFEKTLSLAKRSAIFGVVAAIFLSSSAADLLSGNSSIYLTDRKTFSRLMDYCGEDTCLAFLPRHPIFAHDTTRLYSVWQYDFIDDFSALKNDALRTGIADKIITTRPAVVTCRYRNQDFLLDLFQKELITAADYKQLAEFFKENYAPRYIGKQKYYIRNDKLQ